jgi:hypothetical protein
MSNGLTLPFAGSVSTGGIVFEVTNTFNAPIFGVTVAAIAGKCTGASAGVGVVGVAASGAATGTMGVHQAAGDGVNGQSITGNGVHGVSQSGNGVHGSSQSGLAGYFEGKVQTTQGFSCGGDADFLGKVRISLETTFSSNPLFLSGLRILGDVVQTGHVQVTGKIHCTNDFTTEGNLNAFDVLLPGGDCAEDFNAVPTESIEPGNVVIANDADGAVRLCQDAYDRRVVGVISGAGSFRPGIVLDRHVTQDSRVTVALLGKVYCCVDAQYSKISVGDLLTTSPTPGHAMKATDAGRSFGAIIGKALGPLHGGQGLIPILVALQ